MKLLEKIQLGNLALNNKMVMSAMTRSRADINGVVGDMTGQYYTQRVSAGLIITEAIRISEEATGSPLTPGIYTNEQIDAWKKLLNLYTIMEALLSLNSGTQAGPGTQSTEMVNYLLRHLR